MKKNIIFGKWKYLLPDKDNFQRKFFESMQSVLRRVMHSDEYIAYLFPTF